MSIRIIGGNFRGRRMEIPNSARPTLMRHRQVIFDTLEAIEKDNFGHFFDDKIVIDCFAGTGVLGIEAVSRGAKHAYLIDQNHQAIAILHKNTAAMSDNFTIIRSDLLKLRNNFHVTCDIAFIDPPYGKISINKIINHLIKSQWISDKTLLVIEEDCKNVTNLTDCEVLFTKNSGNTTFRFVKILNNYSALIKT